MQDPPATPTAGRTHSRDGQNGSHGPAAGLPMYDLPRLTEYNDRWWAGLSRHFRAEGIENVPKRMTHREDGHSLWAHPRLLFAQTCGYPLTHDYADRLQVIATPCYEADGCQGPYFSSAIFVHDDSHYESLDTLVDHTAAVNARDSLSGYHALHEAMTGVCRDRPPFRRITMTGSHIKSLAAVRDGYADVCAIDAVTRALLVVHAPRHLNGLRRIGYTGRAPGLPYVTGRDTDAETLARLRRGLFAAMDDPDLSDVRRALLINGAEQLDADDYAEIPRRIDAAQRICPPSTVPF